LKRLKKYPSARFVIIGGSAKEIEAQQKQFARLGIGHLDSFLGKNNTRAAFKQSKSIRRE